MIVQLKNSFIIESWEEDEFVQNFTPVIMVLDRWNRWYMTGLIGMNTMVLLLRRYIYWISEIQRHPLFEMDCTWLAVGVSISTILLHLLRWVIAFMSQKIHANHMSIQDYSMKTLVAASQKRPQSNLSCGDIYQMTFTTKQDHSLTIPKNLYKWHF